MRRDLWTEEMDALLTTCLDRRLTAMQTATVLSRHFGEHVSRNAVIGRASRLRVGLKSGSTGGPGPDVGPLERDRRRREKAEAVLKQIQAGQEREKDWRMLAAMAEPTPIGPPNDIGAGCKWIAGHPQTGTPWRCCGHPKLAGSAYCPHHHARAYDRVSTAESERRARLAVAQGVAA